MPALQLPAQGCRVLSLLLLLLLLFLLPGACLPLWLAVEKASSGGWREEAQWGYQRDTEEWARCERALSQGELTVARRWQKQDLQGR